MSRYLILLLSVFLIASPSVVAVEIGEPASEVGTFIDLEDDLRLQLYAEKNQIYAIFVDAENRVIAAPADSILLEINDTRHRHDDWKVILKPEGEGMLTSPRRFYGPYDFRSRIIIRFTDGETSTFNLLPIDLEENSVNE